MTTSAPPATKAFPGAAEAGFARVAVAAVESSGTPIAIADAEVRLVYVNRAFLRLWGFARVEDVLGRHATEFWADPSAAAGAAAAIGRDGSWSGELVARKADGSEANVRVSANLFSDPVDGAVRMIATFDDVTERVRLEAQLRQSQKMEAVGALAAGIAHDFNNILTVILSLGSVMAEALPEGSPARADVDEIVATARRAEGLTRQILAFARQQVTEPVDLELNATLGGATKLLERIIGAHIAVKLSLAPGNPHVHADPRQLEQVLMNLAVNARDAMPTGGTLAISTFTLPPSPGGAGRVEIVVRDTGTGMDAATRAHAFEPFFTTKPPGRGTGLGLAVVQGIVQQCGGAVTLDSAPGRGTVVRIVLPTRPPRPAAEAAVLTPAPTPAPGRTVLLVEDEERVRRVTARCLERVGYRVQAVADGEDALRLAAATTGPIDLLLTDVVMPGMSGPRLAESLRAARPGLPVLFMTGFAGELPGSLAPPAGGTVLRKPFTPELLVARVAEVLARAS